MRKTILWTSLVLALLLPASGATVTEGVVEAAPQVDVEVVQEAVVSYLPDESYYAGYGDWTPAWENAQEWVESRFDGECYHDVEQRPRMTSGEAQRAKALLADYQVGKIAYTGESVLNKMENVVVGVYGVDPADYDGEKVYAILPGPCMTDEQLLAIIDAYAQLGLTFDPEGLNYRNCARGGGIETNRFFTDEERERYQGMAALIRRGVLDVSDQSRGMNLNPKLDARYFCGLPDFSIKPYRSMTDAELVSLLLDMGVKDESGVVGFDETERRSRKALCGWMGCPLWMPLSQIYTEGGYVPQVFDTQGGMAHVGAHRSSYGADFSYRTQDGILVYAHTMFDRETGELVNASAMHSREWGENEWPPEGRAVTEAEILAAAAEAERMTGCTGLTWHAMTGDETWTNWGECLPVRAQLQEDVWMTIYIGTDDGRLHGVQMTRGALVGALPKDDMPVNG